MTVRGTKRWRLLHYLHVSILGPRLICWLQVRIKGRGPEKGQGREASQKMLLSFRKEENHA